MWVKYNFCDYYSYYSKGYEESKLNNLILDIINDASYRYKIEEQIDLQKKLIINLIVRLTEKKVFNFEDINAILDGITSLPSDIKESE